MRFRFPLPRSISFLGTPAVFKHIAIACFLFAVAGLAHALLAPKWYRSTLTVVPSKSQRSGLAGLMGGGLGSLSESLDAGLGGSADTARIQSVLQSISVTDAVIKKFDLQTRYEQKYIENARVVLWDHCDVRTLVKPNLVQMSCEDTDPSFAQSMLTYFADLGNQVFQRVSVSSATEEVRFLEKHVADLRREADDTATRMRQFQEEHKIVDLESQAKAVVSSLSAVQSQRISKQLQLDFARMYSTDDEATTRQLQSEVSAMSNRLRHMEASNPDPSGAEGDRSPSSFFPAALAVPKLRAEYEKLYRDRRVAEATLVFALERLEGARASAARDTSTFLVLDPPALPTRKSRPQRLVIVLIWLLVGGGGAVALEWLKHMGREPDPGPAVRGNDAVPTE